MHAQPVTWKFKPPYVVNEASAYATGQLPDKEGQSYFCQEDNLYLIPTAEVSCNQYLQRNDSERKRMPIKNVAYSACFRREAGSYGKDVRGLTGFISSIR
jgi:seryl-tRNA synthetase